jgi:alpha-2-macroglobulin
MSRIALRTLIAFILVTIGAAAYAADTKPFVRDFLASDAVRLTETLRKESIGLGAQIKGKSAEQLRKDSQTTAESGDFKQAGLMADAAIAANPKDAANWLNLAKIAVRADVAQASDRWQLVENGSIAAYAAYQRQTAPAAQADALALLGDLLARREMWRPSLDSYRASLERHDDIDVRKIYEDMREKHGFRITDYKVDNDSASPRVCFQFSETLARKTDFAPYVAVSGATNAALSSEDQQICVEGLKHGERYAIVLREGLPSNVGDSLLKAADYEIYVKDRSPQVHFTGKNYVLPREGQLGAPLITVNTAKVALEVFRVGDRNLLATVQREDFLKQISSSRTAELANNDGVKVWTGSMDVANDLNKDVTTEFPVLQAVGKLVPGVYVITARPWSDKPASADENGDSPLATQWLVVSDLGLTALSGADGVHAIVHSLATAAPLAGVEIRLVAHNNEILATKTTGADGRIDFDPGLSRGEGGAAPGLLIASQANDYGFLSLTDTAFDLTDRGVTGRDAPAALDAFLYTERGVYRSGETVFVSALLRDAKGEAKAGLPLTLVAKRPDGVEYKRVVVPDSGLGGHSLTLSLLPGAAPGKWQIEAYADPKAPSIGSVEFLLEDYIPERLDVKLKPATTIASPGEPIAIGVDAKFLYGAPGGGLDVTGAIKLQAVEGSEIPGYTGYVGGLTDEEFTAVQNQFPDKIETDAKGHADLSVDLPEGAASKPLEAKIIVDVAEPGGRTVERVVTLPVRAKTTLIGVKKDFDEGLGDGDLAEFEAIAVSADGSRAARKGVEWSLYKIDNEYQWYNTDGHWDYEALKSSKRIADGSVDIAADAPAKFAAKVSWGRHRLDIKSADGDQTSITFDVGWSGTAGASTPDNVVVTLDKPNYKAGDEAKLRIASHFAGKATIAIVGEKIEQFIDIDLVNGDNVAPFTIGADWGVGAYAVALTHRPLDAGAKRMPGRALGLTWFGIDEAARHLDISLGAPDKARPHETMTLPIKVGGLAAGEEAEVTVAAVDIGILNLTGFKTPDPKEFFFGQRKMAVEIRDLYGLLINGMEGSVGALHSGGDGSGNLEGNLPTQAPLALYSGIVKLDANGAANVSFDMPSFNGAVRVMAVAWSKGKVGSAEAEVIIRDPVVVSGTLPRFLNLGDRSQMHIDIDNVEGDAGDYTIALDIHGPLTAEADEMSKTVKLAAHQRSAVTIPVTAAGLGAASIDLKLTGPRTEATQHFVIGVTPGSPDLYRRAITPLPPGASQTISSDLLADFIPGTGAVSVAASPFGAIDAPALLQSLERYPYGCSEQTVSRAMPLLYANRLASIEHLAIDPDIDGRVKDSIDRVMSRQDSNGAFGLWSADNATDDLWLDAFVTDFLTRARERSFAVPELGFTQALDRLRNEVVNAADPSDDAGIPLAYGLYVLARNGRPVIGDLRYLADTKLAIFKTPMAQAQIAAALAMLGDRARAGKVFAAALDGLDGERDNGYSRPDYGSRLRDSAAVLALLAEANLEKGALSGDPLERAAHLVDVARNERTYTSTQENNWLVLAAEALAEHSTKSVLTVDGKPVDGAINRKWSGFALATKLITIANTGGSTAEIVTTTSGNPIVREPAASQGYELERTFYKMDGTKVDLKSLAQNERLVVVLKVTEAEARYARLLLVDHLPAGLEIDNPNLVDGGSVDAFGWLKKDVDPDHTEYRDDRFVAAFDRESNQSAFFNVAYVVRAVAPGHYVYPPATVEDMYRPERFGRTAYGELEVRAR